MPTRDKAIDRQRVASEFRAVVNMTADQLDEWLATATSRGVGWKGPRNVLAESVGHASGRRTLSILRRAGNELTSDDYAHMRKVVGFVRRHRAQEPANTVTSRWRYSLMNWGHDPLRDFGQSG